MDVRRASRIEESDGETDFLVSIAQADNSISWASGGDGCKWQPEIEALRNKVAPLRTGI
jgi:hypothetical protein